MSTGKQRISGVLAVVAAIASLGACSPPAEPSSAAPAASATASIPKGDTQVRLLKFAFDPDPLRVEIGDEVSWINEDDILHTVTSGRAQEQGVPGVSENKNSRPDGLFDQPLEFGDTFSFTFEETGTVDYFCNIHPGMTGTVVVE